MLIEKNEIVAEVQRKLDASGLSLSQSIIRLVIESEHEFIRESLLSGNRISFEKSFTAKAKKINHRGVPNNPVKGTTHKIDADIDSDLKAALNFRNLD